MTIDLHLDAVRFTRRLRRAGLVAGIEQAEVFSAALALVDPLSEREVELAARASLVFRHEDEPVFKREFDAFWRSRAATPQPMPRAPRHDPSAFTRTALMSYMAQRAASEDRTVELPEREKGASAAELLQRKDFSTLTDEEREAVARAMRGLTLEFTRRRTRRRIACRNGDQPDARRALRAVARHGAVLRVPRRAHKWKQRPLVILADISGSMELYSRLLLQFFHGLTHCVARTETFAFGTRLTRITGDLRLRCVDAALDAAAAEIVDFGGGTRIGACLAAFNRHHAGRVLRRGAVVLVVSDGWDTGDAAVLAREVKRLKRRCHRLVWLSPLLGSPRYEVRTSGMAAVVGLVDDFLPVHDLQSLTQLSRHLARLPS